MDDFAQFKAAVMDLWPRYKTTDGELTAVHNRIRRHGMAAICDVMEGHKYDDPDAYKPTWKVVFSTLSESKGSEVMDVSELAKLLKSERIRLRETPRELKDRQPLDQWSDADVFENKVIIATTRCMRDAKGRRVGHDHPEFERRDRSRRHQEWNFRESYITNLEDRDEQVPEYLRRDRPSDMPDVEAYLARINQPGTVDLKGVFKTVSEKGPR